MGIGASIVLIAAGAILAFALNLDSTAFGSLVVNWEVVGFILMAAGLVGLVWTLFLLSPATREVDRGRRVRVVERDDDEIL
jgi:hypothetical protein